MALTGTFIGMVLAVQSHFQFSQIGLETRLGAVINMSLVRELGPVLAATMLAGRVGSAMAAELGTMRVTEQIDAFESMGANAIHYLVVPRFLACIFLIPTLTIMADFMGVVGAYFYSVFVLGIDRHFYLHNSREFIGGFDLFVGIFKSLFFGAAIAMVSCYRGFHCTPGAEGVGRAATAAFVISFVLILILDLFMGIVLDTVYYAIWPRRRKAVLTMVDLTERWFACESPLVAVRRSAGAVRPTDGAAGNQLASPAGADARDHWRERLRQDRPAEDHDRPDSTRAGTSPVRRSGPGPIE